jgi:integrase
VVLVNVLRATLRRAQIVTGYVHKCRRQGCGHREEAADGDLRRCPKCKFKLWPVGQVLPLRFHDTRHTTASLLMMFGASPIAVQLSFRPKPDPHPSPLPKTGEETGFTSPVLQGEKAGVRGF